MFKFICHGLYIDFEHFRGPSVHHFAHRGDALVVQRAGHSTSAEMMMEWVLGVADANPHTQPRQLNTSRPTCQHGRDGRSNTRSVWSVSARSIVVLMSYMCGQHAGLRFTQAFEAHEVEKFLGDAALELWLELAQQDLHRLPLQLLAKAHHLPPPSQDGATACTKDEHNTMVSVTNSE